ncbi:MAG: helix-turn-helix domain-containing protein [Actinobacteria bacterium]|nr:helix-turn-helix domain-containing protein [Actinomycetota bacterium]
MPDDAGWAVARSRRLAAELRRLRLRSGLTGEQAALRLGWSESKISRIELSRTGVKEGDLCKLLDLYHVSPSHRTALLALAREAASRSRPGWPASLTEEISDYVAAEAEARLVWNWEPRLMPGLLQTADYARAVVAGVQSIFGLPPGDVERRVTARLARQQVLTR